MPIAFMSFDSRNLTFNNNNKKRLERRAKLNRRSSSSDDEFKTSTPLAVSINIRIRDSRPNSIYDVDQTPSKRQYIDLTGDDEQPTQFKKHRDEIIPQKRLRVNRGKDFNAITDDEDEDEDKNEKEDESEEESNDETESDSDDILSADPNSTKKVLTSTTHLFRQYLTKDKSLPRVVHSKTPETFIDPNAHVASQLAQKPAIVAKAYIEIPVSQSTSKELRRHFLKNLERLGGPPIKLSNDIDETSPPVSFNFINSNIIGEGVKVLDEGFMSGCSCREENGRNCGCEYRHCACLQQSARDENGDVHFPYSAKRWRGCLRPFYLNSRHHIYECNKECNCKENCKNKVVQHGRKVPLEIFKTQNRGWGLRCPVALQKGQFLDTYRGEIITNDEAERRGLGRTAAQDNYFMDLDYFTERWTEPKELKKLVSPEEWRDIKRRVKQGDYEIEDEGGEAQRWLNPHCKPPYVCDGMNHGGPSRFLNHSCEPNCRIFTVSYNHADTDIYDIAFFTIEAIAPGTELTFDYKDSENREIITEEKADAMEKKNGYRPSRCLCGTPSCRRYFFT